MTSALEQACTALEAGVQSLVAALALRRKEGEPLRVLLASPRHGDGTSLVAMATAVALCRTLGPRVALVEANVFRPSLGRRAGVRGPQGFAECLSPEAGASTLHGSFLPGLELLPAGQSAPTLAHWGGTGVRRLFADELRSFSFVIVDAPPLLDRPVGRLLLPSCDVAALVIRAGSTTRADARAATGVLHDSGVATLGAIANRVRLSPVL